MNTTEGLMIIALLAFIISMLVATIIWLLSLFSAKDQNKHEGGNHSSFLARIRKEVKFFSSFQKLYRTYWDNANSPSNELIQFYHEQ